MGLEVATRRVGDDVVGQRGPGGRLVPAPVGDQGLQVVAHVLLVVTRLFATGLPLVGGPETRTVGGEDLVDQHRLVAALDHAELELGIGQHNAAVAGVVAGQTVKGQGSLLQPEHRFLADDLRAFVEADVLVVAGIRLGRGREQRRFQPVAVPQSFGQIDAAHLAGVLVVLPAGAGQVATGDALDGQHPGLPAEHDSTVECFPLGVAQAGDVGCIGGDEVVVDDAGEVLEPKLRDLRQDHAFAGGSVGEHDVKRADPVRGDDQERVAAVGQLHVVEVADLAAPFVGESEIRLHHEFRLHVFSVVVPGVVEMARQWVLPVRAVFETARLRDKAMHCKTGWLPEMVVRLSVGWRVGSIDGAGEGNRRR